MVDQASHKRFLIVASYAPSLLNFRGPLMSDLIEQGYEVHAVAPGLTPDSSATALLRANGVAAHNVRISRTGLTPLNDLRLIWDLMRLMRRLRPQTVMGYTIKPVIWGILAAWASAVPRRVALITGLGLSFDSSTRLKQRFLTLLVCVLYRIALSRAHVVIFQNRDDLNLFQTRQLLSTAARVQVVDGSGVDLSHFLRTTLPGGPLQFVLVARMIASKGVREYAEAARRIRCQHPTIQFHLVGGIDINPDSIALDEIKRWQADKVLIWHNQLNDVRPIMNQSHVVVLPSYYREGIPRSLLEALALGRPIITTDMPGCRETVRIGRNGLLVPPRDVDALVQAMLEMLVIPRAKLLEMSDASYRIALDRFDVSKVNRDMIRAIEGIEKAGQP